MNTYLDFESRSRAEIWDCGAYAYSIHPSTEVLCLVYAIDDQAPILYRKEDLGVIPPFDIKGNVFIAHNAFFEQCIWNNIMVKKWGWPRIPINQFKCTMAKSLASAYPQSLDNACKALQTDFQKSFAGKSIMMKLCKPNSKGGWNEDPEDFEKLYQYCIDDVLAERSLDHALPDLIPTEQTIWYLDQFINQRGIQIDRDAVHKALTFVEEYTTRLNNTVFEESGFSLDRVTRRQAVLDWCKKLGCDIPGYTKADVAKTLEQDLPAEVRTVLEAKLQLGKTSVAKYQSLKNATTEDGRLRDTLIYHGASTGRWTGKLFQLQNLPKGTISDIAGAIDLLKEAPLETFEIFYPDVMGTLSSCIRGMIIAGPGTELFVGDYSAIEARVLMWLAGEKKGLEQWEKGEDLYVKMAQKIYGKEIISKKERELGKTVVLGAGYGLGKVKFESTCNARGVEVSPELAEKAINTYRETYATIKQMWYEQEAAAIEIVKKKGKATFTQGAIVWWWRNNNLMCTLPSGRSLTYPGAHLDYTDSPVGKKLTLHYWAVNGTTKRWDKEKTYGGKIVENITQAVARDILAQAMLRLEKAGYPVIFSVHDEIVCEVPKDKGSIAQFGRLLCESVSWSGGLPLKAECWSGQRYKKG